MSPRSTTTFDHRARARTRPIVVVGGGLAGLTAGLRLARDGDAVTVVEGRAEAGGRARTTDRAGHLLNLGPHALALGGPGTAVLRELGIALPGRQPALAAARLLEGDRLVHPVRRTAGGAGLRLAPVLARLTRRARGGDVDGTVIELLDTMTTDPRARRALDALVRLATYADAFDEQAADVLTEQLRASPVRYLDGGWGALVARLRDAFVAAGGELLRGSGAGRVHLDTMGGAEVELTDGRSLRASAVLLAAGGPAQAAALVDGPVSARLDAWAEAATPVRLASLDVALARRPEVPPVVLGADRPVYLSVHSDRARLAPDGGAVVHLARFLPLGARPPADTRTELEGVLDALDPRWRAEVVHARFLPDLVLTHDGGAVATGGRRGRPGPTVPEAPQLFVAGDWVGTRGHLAQASLASAALAADLAASYVAGGASTRPVASRDRDVAGVA